MSTPDPWAWSLDALIAVLGVAIGGLGVLVAGLGAIATTLIAAWALVSTNRANKLEAEARARAGRVSLSSAIDAYLAGWSKDPSEGVTRSGLALGETLTMAARSISSGSVSVTAWVIRELTAATAQVIDEHGDGDNIAGERLLGIATAGAAAEIRRRVATWVETGALDRSPLLSTRPIAPTFGAA